MISNKIFTLSTSSNNSYGKEALINIGNSEKLTRSSTKHCNSKNISILKNILRNILFFRQNFRYFCQVMMIGISHDSHVKSFF